MKLPKFNILLLDTKNSNPNHYLCICIEQALKANSNVEAVYKANYGNAIELATKNSCNLFFAFDGEELQLGVCRKLREICGISILWITDDPYEVELNIKHSKLFDIIYTNDSGSLKHYGNKGRHLPFAASNSMHFLEVIKDNNNFLYDIFFAGTAWPNRIELLKSIMSGIADLSFKLALPGNEFLPKPDLNIDDSALLWRTPNTEFCRFANLSRITLTLHRSFSSSGSYTTAQTPGPRFFEVALSGGFQIVDMSLPEVGQYFEEGKDFIGFNTPEECIEKIKYYLKHTDERISIALSAQQKAQNLHLYEHRIEKIINDIRKIEVEKNVRSLNNKKKNNILFVSHNVVGIKPFGGVEVYQSLIQKGMENNYNFYYYVPDRSDLHRPGCILYDNNLKPIEVFKFTNAIDSLQLTDSERECAFSKILDRFEIDLVHFQHLIGHIPSLPIISKAQGVKNIITLHDYYSVCDDFNLINYNRQYCNIFNLPYETCDVCLNAKFNGRSVSQLKRRSFYSKIWEYMDLVFVNTNKMAEYFIKIYPNLESKIKVRGVPSNDTVMELNKNPIKLPLKIAIPGNFTFQKGGDVYIHIFNQMRRDLVEFHIFGGLQSPFDDILNALNFSNVFLHGFYSPGKHSDELRQMTMSMHLSIWPETYVLTLSEAWQTGLVPIVSDIGALGERVKNEVNGFKVPANEAGSAINLLRRIIADTTMINQIKENILLSQDYEPLADHLEWIKTMYELLLDEGWTNRYKHENKRTDETICFNTNICGFLLNSPRWDNNVSSCGSLMVTEKTVFEGAVKKTINYYKQHGIKCTIKKVYNKINRKLR